MQPPLLRATLRLLAGTVCVGVLILPTSSAAAHSDGAADHGSRTVRHDVTYIAMLVPHHRSAVDMAAIARQRATNPEVRRLAAHIADEQTKQIRQMQEWLDRRDAQPNPPPAPVREMEQQDLQMLREAQGAQVDQMFLMMMRPHHAQAVSESEDEIENGRNSFAVGLARTTKADQAREISQMNELLSDLM